MVTAKALCDESLVEDMLRRAERFTRDTKDARFETMLRTNISALHAVENSTKALSAAYDALDLETCMEPATATPEKVAAASLGIVMLRKASQAFGEALVQHRRLALAELDRLKVAVTGPMRAESDQGFDLTLKLAEGGLHLADTAENALKAFKMARTVDPQNSKRVLVAAESFEAAGKAVAAHRDKRQQRINQILPR